MNEYILVSGYLRGISTRDETIVDKMNAKSSQYEYLTTLETRSVRTGYGEGTLTEITVLMKLRGT